MATPVDLHLGNRLRRRRRMMGMTQRQLAEAIGVRFQQIHKYECGANSLSAARLWSLAQAMQTPISYFFEGLTSEAAAAPAVRPAAGGEAGGEETPQPHGGT